MEKDSQFGIVHFLIVQEMKSSCVTCSQYNNMEDMDPESPGPPYGECNHGAVIAKSVGAFDSCYTSQLIVTIGEEMINETVECSVYNVIEGISTTIDQKSLVVTTVPYPPPTNIHIESNDSVTPVRLYLLGMK